MHQQRQYPPPRKKFPWWGYILAVLGFLFVLGAISTLATGGTAKPTPTAPPAAIAPPTTRGPTPTSIYASDPTVQAAVKPTAPLAATTTKATTMTVEEIVKAQLAESHRGTFESVTIRDLGQGKILAIDYTGIGNNKSFINQAMLEFKESTPLYFSQLPDIMGLDVKAYADFTDTTGQSTRQVAVRLGISRANSDKIKWPNTLIANMENLADSVYIHPAIMKYWAELKAG